MHKQLLRSRLPIVIGLIVATGCSTLHTNTTASSAPPLTANGRSIFQTGKDLSGVQIVARKPPLFWSCAACHRADGSGVVRLPGDAVSADLRHAALVTKAEAAIYDCVARARDFDWHRQHRRTTQSGDATLATLKTGSSRRRLLRVNGI